MSSKRNREEIEHFSNLDHIWWGARTVAGQRRYDYKLDLMKELFNPSPKARVLEIGCGDGEFTKRLAKTGAVIIATDLTPKVLLRAKKKYRFKNVKFEEADAEQLSYPKNTFDLVCGVSILHHLDCAKALSEARRVLKKGGRIFFTEPNLLNPQVFFGLNLPFLRKEMEFSPQEKAFTRWTLEKAVKKVGYRNVKVDNYDFLHPNTPGKLVPLVKLISGFLEHTPIVKEVSGSLYIFATK